MRRSMIFCQESPGSTDRKQPRQRFFFAINLFYSLQRGGVQYSIILTYYFLFQRKLYFSKVSEGPTFSRGFQRFRGGGGVGGWGGGGVQMLISIETHITCEFLRV